MFRYLKALWYWVTGRTDEARKTLLKNKYVMAATYKAAIEENEKRVSDYRDAIAGMERVNQDKIDQIGVLSKGGSLGGVSVTGITQLQKLKDGALALCQGVLKKYNGDKAAAEADADYLKYKQQFGNYSGTLSERTARVEVLRTEVAEKEVEIKNHELGIKSLMQQTASIKERMPAALAEMKMAEMEKQAADRMAGLNTTGDTHSKELAEIDEIIRDTKAGAKVATRVAGLNIKQDEHELLAAAEASQSNGEFEKLMGFSDTKEAVTTAPVNKMPEA